MLKSSPSYTFKTSSCGKWILAGEHRVVRGGRAIAFPLPNKRLYLTYDCNKEQPLEIVCRDENHASTQAVQQILAKAEELIGSRIELRGKLTITNQIPIGSGLGASAAICVAVARLLVHERLLAEESLQAFAVQLENIFHSKSSGVDIATVIAERPIIYEAGESQMIKLHWQPSLYLHSTGICSQTSLCVQKVQEYTQNHPDLAPSTEQKMASAVESAINALQDPTEEGLKKLAHAINSAYECFIAWDLIPPQSALIIKQLHNLGAIACKPTGSGNGGYLLTLWKSQLQPQQLTDALYCF